MSIEEFNNVNSQVFDHLSRKAWSLSVAYRKGMRFDKVYTAQQDRLVCFTMLGIQKMNNQPESIYSDCVIPSELSQEAFNKFISFVKRTYHGRI